MIKLPYKFDAFEPILSENTLSFHYSKHHLGYEKKLQELLGKKEYCLKTVMKDSFKKEPKIFNNAAQVWNHDFYWKSMSPKEKRTPPSTSLMEKLNTSFGSMDRFKEIFIEKSTTLFGSGWVWLIEENNTFEVIQTNNAENPLCYSQKPLMTCDVWEHAYYLDYQNRRPDYAKYFFEELINWEFIENQI